MELINIPVPSVNGNNTARPHWVIYYNYQELRIMKHCSSRLVQDSKEQWTWYLSYNWLIEYCCRSKEGEDEKENENEDEKKKEGRRRRRKMRRRGKRRVKKSHQNNDFNPAEWNIKDKLLPCQRSSIAFVISRIITSLKVGMFKMKLQDCKEHDFHYNATS